LLMHLFVDTSNLPMALVIWAMLGWIIVENKEKYLQLLK
jgi:hypothetical protein